MADWLSFTVSGDQRLVEDLSHLYPQAAARGVENGNRILLEALNRYVGNAPYNYLSWAQGGPGEFGGFFSERQRAFVMASIAQDSMTIPYPRVKGDKYHLSGSGIGQKVVSDDVSMYYSMSDEGQTIMQALRGWDKISVFLVGHEKDIVAGFEQGVKAVISEMLSHTAP
jgi:hypothetical protein